MFNNTVSRYNGYSKDECKLIGRHTNSLFKNNNYHETIKKIYNDPNTVLSSSYSVLNPASPTLHPIEAPHETDEEKTQASLLFTCVALFKKHPESLSTAAPGKKINIQIADQSLIIATKKITLPGGYTAYVGLVAGRWLVSDGVLYHIDGLVNPPNTWLDTIVYLLGHLTGVVLGYGGTRLFPPSTQGAPEPRAAMPSPPVGLCSGESLLSSWARITRIPTPFSMLSHLSGLTWFFPVADGAKVEPPPPEVLFPWLKISDKYPSFALKRPPRQAANVTNSHPAALPLISDPPTNEGKNSHEDAICETNLHIANHSARELYQAIKQQFIPLTNKKIYSLAWMSELNVFLYDKLFEIYNDGTYLDNKTQYTDMIMLKKYIEKNIDNCVNSSSKKKLNDDILRDYFSEYRTIADFFPLLNIQIERTIYDINFKMLRELIDFKNGISYADAKKNLQQLIDESPADKAKIYKEQLFMLAIMQQAQHTYEKLLISDSIPLLDRLIYFNSREIFHDMLDERPIHLRRILLKRFFYYIFEYSRNNGLSIQGNYLIIPGELTEYRSLFDQTEAPLTETEIAELVANQIVDYIHGSNKYHPHIDRLIRDIEYYRIHSTNSVDKENWSEDNMRPYKETLQSLDKSVKTNLERMDNTLYQQNPQWINELVDQVKYDKECILLLSFLEKLQAYLIEIVSEHQHEHIQLGSRTNEQRLAEAKIQAMIMASPGDSFQKTRQEILTLYFTSVTAGDVSLLLRAAIYWYIDYHRIRTDQLSGLSALYIIKEFQAEKKQISLDFESRSSENFKKIFDLKPSDEFQSAREFYNQFIHYKDYSLQQEARQFTYKIISRSALDYLDMIYPPKEVYTFKIYSRNYVQNSLAPNTDVYLPNNNFGTFSLIKTYSHKVIIASTLFSAPFIKTISMDPDNIFFNNLIDEYKKTNFDIDWIHRLKIPVTANDILELFDIPYDSTQLRMSPLSLFLIEPEEIIRSMPKPDYVLVAGEEKGDYQTMIEILDYWNAIMLREIVDQLKISLRIKKWWQELLALIPFYEILWKYVNDADNEFNGIEVIFDTFDLAFMLGQLTTSAAKGTGVIYKRLINIANIETLPVKQLNRAISQKLAEELPYIARKSSGSIFSSVIGYLNPLPIHAIFSKKIKHHLSENMATVITWMSNFILNNMEQKMTKFIQWSSDIDRNLLIQKRDDGSFVLDQGQGTTQNFIEIDEYFFQVIWDAAIKTWRVVKPTEVMNLNYAVPMYKNEKGKWAASSFLDNDRFSITARSGRRTRYINDDVDFIHMEPIRSITLPIDHYKDNKWMYIQMLELMVNDYVHHIESLFLNNGDMSKMLTDFVNCLTSEAKFREVFTHETDSNVNVLLLQFIKGLSVDGGVNVGYRMQRLWQNEHDRSPVDHLVIILRINKNDYIVDMIHLRPYGAGLIIDRQVFNEPEWAHLTKKSISSDFPLIKYKDFSKISTAISFPYREAGHPGKYIKGAILLREPIWYKTVAIKYYYRYVKKEPSNILDADSSILSAARTMISSYNHHHRMQTDYNLNVTFPFLILKEAKVLDARDANEMQQRVTLAFGQNYPAQSYMSSILELIDSTDLLKLKPGKLLGLYYDDVFLSHLLISVGEGRFAGVGNNLFDPLFESGPSIIVAEEMGTFDEGKLAMRGTNEQYTVLTGNPVNAPANETLMLDKLALKSFATKPEGDREPSEEIVYASRERMLTQDNWTLFASPNSSLLTLKMEAVSQNIYPVASREMAHIIRGMFYANSQFPDIAEVECIELITLFDGFAAVSLRGQILANDLRLDVQLCPYLATDGIRQRQPQWFTRFSPAAQELGDPLHMPADTPLAKEDYRDNRKIKHLADMVEMLITIRTSLNNARIKRNVGLLPAIFSDLARLVIRDMNFYEFIGQYRMDKESEEKLYHILKEYQGYISEGDEYYLQCYFDLLLSVERFQQLAETIYPMPSLAASGTRPIWPYIS